MRTPMIASFAMIAALAAAPADAQRLGRGQMVAPQTAVPPSGPQGGPPVMMQPAGQMPMQMQRQRPVGGPRAQSQRVPNQRFSGQRFSGQRFSGQRWGGSVGGRWIGGVQAPGGWNAYRRPGRGFNLPGYWIAPSFFIGNFAQYGLAPPPFGYHWSRYYDDAVLIDDRGQVYESVQGIGWDEDGDVVDQPGYGAPYPAPGVGYDGSYQGTYEIDGRTGYQQGRQSGRYAPKPPVQGGPVIQPLYPHGYTQTWSAGSGYYYPGGVTTTITIQQAPATVTTTTTEYIEETVYRAPVRRSYRKPARKTKAKCVCR